MLSSGMLCHMVLVRTNVSEECSSSTIRVTRIGELGVMLEVTSNWCTPRRNIVVCMKWYWKVHNVRSKMYSEWWIEIFEDVRFSHSQKCKRLNASLLQNDDYAVSLPVFFYIVKYISSSMFHVVNSTLFWD
jgi:hypothetical protein